MNKWLERLKTKTPDAEIPQMFSYQTAKTAKRHLKDESDLLDLGAYQDYEAKQGQDRKAISFPRAESSTIGPTPESSALDPVQVAPPRPYLDKERDLVIHEELFFIAVPEKLKAAIDNGTDQFGRVFLESLQKINELYLVGTLPFIRELHPERFKKLETIMQEMIRLRDIKVAFRGRWTKAGEKNNLDRFRGAVLTWYQWFFHAFYLFINQESDIEKEEKNMEKEKLVNQEEADDRGEEDDIDGMVDEYLDDLVCRHSCDYYGTKKGKDLCEKDKPQYFLFKVRHQRNETETERFNKSR